MLNKALIAAAAVSILASGFTSTAEAASSSANVRDHRAPEVRDHRTKVEVRDHRAKRHNEVVKISRPKFECSLGKEKLWWSGYKSIKAYDCQGTSYGYRAIKGHGIFQATMNAYSGKMNIEFVGIAN